MNQAVGSDALEIRHSNQTHRHRFADEHPSLSAKTPRLQAIP
jgi:hypothetical protein